MNANELADKLSDWYIHAEEAPDLIGEAATMLRQQQAEIKTLKSEIVSIEKNADYWADKANWIKNNKPVAWMFEDEPWFDGDKWHKKFKTTMSEQVAVFKSGTIKKPIPLYTHPANACKHGVDDGACKECYLESSNPYKAITNTKIEPTAVSYTHPVKEQELLDEIKALKGGFFDWSGFKELTDDEKWEVFTNLARSPDLRTDMIRFANSILRKAQEK